MSKIELCLTLKQPKTTIVSHKPKRSRKSKLPPPKKLLFTALLKPKILSIVDNTNNIIPVVSNDTLTFKKKKHSNVHSNEKSIKLIDSTESIKPIDSNESIKPIDYNLDSSTDSVLTRADKRRIVTAKKPKCLARTATGTQCPRSKISDDTVFCHCHQQHCPYGRIDGPLEGKKFLSHKKRGPKTIVTKEYTLDELDQNMYLSTQLVKIDENLYLIDKLGLLFTNDPHSEIVGRKINDEIHWFL
jgi:hypothetical protein